MICHTSLCVQIVGWPMAGCAGRHERQRPSYQLLVGLGLVIGLLAVGCSTSEPSAAGRVATQPPAATAETPAADAPAADAPPVVPAVRAAAAPPPLLALDPQPAPQSGQVRVAGQGFGPSETVTLTAARTGDASSDKVPLRSATTNAAGSVEPTTINLPDELLSGPHPFEAVGETSGRRGTATLWVHALEPWLVLSSYDIPQYGDLGVVAGGFAPMEQVQVALATRTDANDSGVALASLTTDQAGNGEWTQIKLPRVKAGPYVLVLHGQAGGQELRREVQVTPLKPLIEPSPWAGPPGVSAQLNARGFGPSEQVRVWLGVDVAATPSATLQSDEYGNLWGAGPIQIPQTTAPGPLTVTLLGADSGARASFEFKVLEPKPWLELTSWSGAPGSPVGFGGGGWIAGERVSFSMGKGGGPSIASATADANGWLHPGDAIYVPKDADDEVTFVAVGEQSHLSASATFKVVFPFGLRPGQPSAPSP